MRQLLTLGITCLGVLSSRYAFAADPAPIFKYDENSKTVEAIYTHDYISNWDFNKGIIYKLTVELGDPCLTFQTIIPSKSLHLLNKSLRTAENLPASHLCEFKSEFETVTNAHWPKKVTLKNTYRTISLKDASAIKYYNLQWIGNTPNFILEYVTVAQDGHTDYYSCGIRTGLSELMGGFTGSTTKPSILCYPVDIDGSSPDNPLGKWQGPHQSLLEPSNAPSH